MFRLSGAPTVLRQQVRFRHQLAVPRSVRVAPAFLIENDMAFEGELYRFFFMP